MHWNFKKLNIEMDLGRVKFVFKPPVTSVLIVNIYALVNGHIEYKIHFY